MVPAATRFPRTKTAIVLTAAGGVVVAAALLSARRAPPPQAADAAAGGMSLSARSTSRAVLRGTSETDLSITVRAPELDARERPPVTMAVVLDRSGSMSGEPLEHAKAAAERLIDSLAADDRFAVVAYSTRASLLAPMDAATPDAKARAKAMIERLDADGGTNISEGLSFGADALAKAVDRDDVHRVVLISDGQANEGVYDRAGLDAIAADIAAHGASITAVGVGLDFDERTMVDLATVGRGNYYFAERVADLGQIFDRELGSLGQTVASDATLTIDPAPGVDILEAYGYRTDRVGTGTGVVVPIADLRAGETRKVVIRVRVTASEAGTIELAKVGMQFRPRDAHQMMSLSTTAVAEVTTERRVVEQGLDREVVRQVEVARTARALEQATAAYEDGKDDEARAILQQRAAEGQAQSDAIGDPALGQQIQDITAHTSTGFAAAPAARGDDGRRAVKATRQQVYELMQ
ncbi:MAG: VWA domain-containing protein [Deltaproteobacteria bacterium]|nr:VWA domain-containing protein [Deltaproteobacteria bacterium]